MSTTRIDSVDVRCEGGVVRIRQRRGTGDLVLGAVALVGLSGVASIATGPVSVATWLMGPFVVLFTVVGLGGLALRLLRRDEVVIDRGRRQMSSAGRTVPVTGRLRVDVVKGALGVRTTWHVDLVSSTGSLRVVDFTSRATADRLAAELRAVVGWPDAA